jgi:hypothetical protein
MYCSQLFQSTFLHVSAIAAISLLEQLEVVKRLLSAMGEGQELEHAGEKHSIALCVAFHRIKTIKTDEKLELIVAIEGLRMNSTAKGRLLAQVQGKCESASRKRPLQDYVSWPNFCTPRVWRDITDTPPLATEILCQHLNSLGLILPSKDTEKSIAAHAIVGEYGQFAASVSDADAKRVFKGVSKRIKQLYKAEPMEFIAKLPPSPAAFLKSHPAAAKAVFSRENLPCACPLDRMLVSHAETKIRCRETESSSSQDVNHDFMRQMMCMMGSMHRIVQSPRQPEINLLQPLRLQEPSAGACRFQQLEDEVKQPEQRKMEDAVVPKQPEDAVVPKLEDAVVLPPCLQLLDGASKVETAGDVMRQTIIKARSDQLADRSDAKKATTAAMKRPASTPLKIASMKRPATIKIATMKRPASTKPPSWIKAAPFGCPKCRHSVGCTRSCYISRGAKVPT